MAGTEKHVIQTATFAPVSCRRLATDFRNHLLDYMPHPRKLRLPRMGILFGRTMNDMNRIDKLVKIISRSTLLGREIDVYGTTEEPLFKAKDVAEWLELTNVTDMVSRIDEEELTKFNLGSRQGETWFLTKDGLYEVLMQSRKPIAKQFKKGVKEILKKIRKPEAIQHKCHRPLPKHLCSLRNNRRK